MPSLSAVVLEAGSVVRLGETVPRAILFGLGLFAWWLAIYLLVFRVVATGLARKPIADPVDRRRAELGDAIKLWPLCSCAIMLFIVFPWAQGFAMPPCSVLAAKLFSVYSVVCGITVAWVGLRLWMALRAQKSARLNSEELRDSGESASVRTRFRSGARADLGTQSGFALPQS